MCGARLTGSVAVAVADHEVPEIRYERDPATLVRRLVNGVLVLGPTGDGPVRISGPGDAVWALLGASRTPSELAADLSEIFDAPVGVVRADLDPVLTALLNVDAIRAVPGPG
jgi:hypothetical protein